MEVITKQVYTVLELCRERLYDEVVHNVYINGKGTPFPISFALLDLNQFIKVDEICQLPVHTYGIYIP